MCGKVAVSVSCGRSGVQGYCDVYKLVVCQFSSARTKLGGEVHVNIGEVKCSVA